MNAVLITFGGKKTTVEFLNRFENKIGSFKFIIGGFELVGLNITIPDGADDKLGNGVVVVVADGQLFAVEDGQTVAFGFRLGMNFLIPGYRIFFEKPD